jgi:hypothetical protein
MRIQCSVEVELIVARHGDDRRRTADPGAVQYFTAIGASGHKIGTRRDRRPREFLTQRRNDGDAMVRQPADFGGRADRQRTVADDERQRPVGGSAAPSAHRGSPLPGG